mgnify:CR=1 FL=1
MITINIDKAKVIGHDMRRAARAEEFAPLDEMIAKQIPNTNLQAVEMQRQTVRDKYATIQTEINSATTTEEIKEALGI